MSKFIDLSHVFENGMPGFRLKNEEGVPVEFSAQIKPFLTHAQSAHNYEGKASFEITDVAFQSSIGTYMDAPKHRHEGMGDIASLELETLINPGIVIDGRHCTPEAPLTAADMPSKAELKGKAVLINFGWEKHWGDEAYYTFPHVDRSGLEHLLDAGISLFGVDTINADNVKDMERPAHTWLLKEGIHILENLRGLDQLYGKEFRFYSIPLRAKGAAAFPIRAFAELN